jgi:negative regulator of replication initiation
MGRFKQIGIDVDVHRMIEQHRRSFTETENDILRRIFLSEQKERPSPQQTPSTGGFATSSARSRGMWSVELRGRVSAAANLKDAYRSLLEQLADADPEFLQKFSREKGRSRRFVAQSREALYATSPHLAKDHAKPLRDGWYFDTNLSAEQVAQRARIAARVCGLLYGRDVRILENLKEI